MSEPTKESLYENGRSFDAYYYSFDPTGDYRTDVVLHAVAKAGKSYHSTEDWHRDFGPYTDHLRGKSAVEWIQNAAEDAAAASRQMQEQIKQMRQALQDIRDLSPIEVVLDPQHAIRIARAALSAERKTTS